MNLVVVSSPHKFESELKLIPQLFDLGLETFHLRKPKFSYSTLNRYLKNFPKEHLNKVVVHSHHRLALQYNLKGVHITEKKKRKKVSTAIKLKLLKFFKKNIIVTTSFHSVNDLLLDKKNYEYVFLSPIFQSISKKNYGTAFSEETLKKVLSKTHHKVVALGGINSQNIIKAAELEFSGVAVLGALWEEEKYPVKIFVEIRNLCKEKELKSSKRPVEI